MTVEQIIADSVKEFKKVQAQKRREHIRKLIDLISLVNLFTSSIFSDDKRSSVSNS